jgi:hypothetical protein
MVPGILEESAISVLSPEQIVLILGGVFVITGAGVVKT